MTPPITVDAPTGSVLHDLLEILHDLGKSRSLIYQLTLRDIRVRYKQAVMGFAWAILSPLLIVAAGIVIRIAMLHMSGQPFDASTANAIVVKGLAWGFFASAIGFATTSLTGNGALITKVYFARETLPLSVILASTFDSLIGTVAMFALLPFLGWHPTWAMLWVPLLAILLFLLTLAVGLFISCANLFFRDVRYLTQLLITFGIFFTPVYYEPAALGSRLIVPQMLNPLAPIVEGLRLSVVDGHNLFTTIHQAGDGAVVWSPLFLGYSALWATGGLILAAVLFHRAQYRFAEYV
ncbi:MAG: ABC transporter permease [Gemmatimonadaceae bacterium]